MLQTGFAKQSLFLAASLLIFVILSVLLTAPNEDAFISFRYVDNLLAGNGLVYNVGERVEGYSCFLWIMLLSAAGAMGFDIVGSSVVLGIIAGALTLLAAFKLSKLLISGSGQWWVPLLAPFTLALFTPFVSWSGSGLETMFYTLLVTLGCYQYLRYVAHSTPFDLYSASAILALVAMTRPEGILFAGGMFFYEFVRCYFPVKTFRPQATSLLCALLIFFSLFLAWFLWRAIYYQSLLPNTVYAKNGGTLFHFYRGLTYVARFLRACWEGSGPLLFLGIFSVLSNSKYQIRFLFIELALQILFIIYVGGDYMVNARFGAPILPIMAALAVVGVHSLLPYVQGVPRNVSRFFAVSMCIVIALVKVPEVLDMSRSAALEVSSRVNVRRRIGQWLHQNCPPDTVTSIGTAGIIPYYSRLFNIDFSGINDKYIARFGLVELRIGHQRFDGDYVLSRRPDLFIIDPGSFDSDEVLFASTSGNHFYRQDLTLATKAIVEHPRFADYIPMYIQLDTNHWLQVFVRSDWEIPSGWMVWHP